MVAAGEVVAIVLPNSIEFHVAYFAALKALAAPALLNPVYPSVELALLLREAAPAHHPLRTADARHVNRSRARSGHT